MTSLRTLRLVNQILYVTVFMNTCTKVSILIAMILKSIKINPFSNGEINKLLKRCLLILFLLTISALGNLAYADESLKADRLQGIYVGHPLSKIEKITTEHLRIGMQKLYNIRLSLLKSQEATNQEGPLLILGQKAALESGRLTENELTEVTPGGHVIKSDKIGIVIAGPDAWSTRYGVYHFLEKLGMRFFSPHFGKAQVIKSKNGEIPFLFVSDKPAFTFRNHRSHVWRQMTSQIGDPHNGLNPELFDPKKTNSDLWIDHTAGYLVPKLLYYNDHPEYYAMQKNGKRVARDSFTDHRTPLCLSNPDVINISIERALGWIKKEPDKRFFFITYGDTGLWCQSPQDQRLDPRPGEYTDRLLSWVNPIAIAVRQKYPDRTLLTFAYGGTSNPPKKQIPEDNVWIVGSTGLGNIPFWDHVIAQKKLPSSEIEKIRGWLKIVPNRYALVEYQSGTYKPALIDNMVARLKFYKGLGIRGVVFSYGRPKNFTMLWKFLWGKMMWNPNQDAMNLARGFINYHYGPAAESIWKILKISHERYVETLGKGNELKNQYPVGYYSEKFAKNVLDYFFEAKTAVVENTKLLKKIKTEESYFIQDWMGHPNFERIDEKARNLIFSQLNRLLSLVGESDKKKIQLTREIHRLALRLDATHPGTVEIAEKWIKQQNLYRPAFEKLTNGVRLTPESFMFAGYGPARYSWKCPPKQAVGIYVKGNSRHRSHRMISEFELDLMGDGKNATLTLEGQVSEHPLKPKIIIKLNNTEIFSGSADFVKNNWSKQSYPVPEGVLKKGKNKLEFINISHPISIFKWNQRWLLISDATITFSKKT